MFQGTPTNVSLGMVVTYVDIDELNGKLTTHCWLNLVSPVLSFVLSFVSSS